MAAETEERERERGFNREGGWAQGGGAERGEQRGSGEGEDERRRQR